MSKKHHIWALCFFLAISFGIETVGALATKQSIHSWYPNLTKPNWIPPAWLFGPVWTILYALIALCGWLAYISPSTPQRTKALIFYSLQLVLNLLWSPLFFGLQSPFLALMDISVLWILILITLFYLWQVNRLAAFLWIPYLLWVSYAFSLNVYIFIANR